jgi:predicted dehydrogenase
LSDQNNVKGPRILSRRDFLLAAAAVGGSGIVMANTTGTVTGDTKSTGPLVKTNGDKAEIVNVALIGAGAQGRVLIDSLIYIPGIKMVAICDIWSYSQRYASRYLKKYGHVVNVYEDYKEMLDKEKDLHAVVIATPDFMHAEHTIACLEAGHHVYCEKEMAHTLDEAREMVVAQRRTGKLLQIGHQRRSNPRYKHVVENLFEQANLLGRINHAYGQWNRSKSDDLTAPKNYEIPKETLEKYGYANMHEFRNWRWFKKYGGGPIVDLGSHQIDIFSWVFGANPISVMAAGGRDYYTNHEWYDNVYAIYEYQTQGGVARASYKVLTTTKHGQFYETFMGDMASLDISEVPNRGNWAWQEEHAPSWDEWVAKGWIKNPAPAAEAKVEDNVVVDVRVTSEAAKWELPVELAKPAHQPHLENFFNAIREGEKLNCPGEIGYETAVAVLKVNEAVEAEKKLHFNEADFIVS